MYTITIKQTHKDRWTVKIWQAKRLLYTSSFPAWKDAFANAANFINTDEKLLQQRELLV